MTSAPQGLLDPLVRLDQRAKQVQQAQLVLRDLLDRRASRDRLAHRDLRDPRVRQA